MSEECQQIEIRRIRRAFDSTDIGDFNLAVTTIVATMSGEPIFNSWMGTYSSVFIDIPTADLRYVNITGDVMTGGLFVPSLTSNNASVGSFVNVGTTVNFLNEFGRVDRRFGLPDIYNFESVYTTVLENSGIWGGIYPSIYIDYPTGDARYVSLSGGTMTGGLYVPLLTAHDTKIENSLTVGNSVSVENSITVGGNINFLDDYNRLDRQFGLDDIYDFESVYSTVFTNSATWGDTFSSVYLTTLSGDARYVNVTGDVMTGGLSVPTLTATNSISIRNSVNFFDAFNHVDRYFGLDDIYASESVYNTVFANSATWGDTYSSVYLTIPSGDVRYVNITGDVMTGGLSIPTLTATNSISVRNSINFFDAFNHVDRYFGLDDIYAAESVFSTVLANSATWGDVYSSVYISIPTGDARYVNVGGDVMTGALSVPSLTSTNNVSVKNFINFFDDYNRVSEIFGSSDIFNFKSAYSTVLANSAMWAETYSSTFIDFPTGDARYVNISGDTMTGSLFAPTFSTNNATITNTIAVGNSINVRNGINFTNSLGAIIYGFGLLDIYQFRAVYTLVQENSALWLDTNSGFITTSEADIRYVNIAGDVMTGSLTVPSLTSRNNVSVRNDIHFFDEYNRATESFGSDEIFDFKSVFSTVHANSAAWVTGFILSSLIIATDIGNSGAVNKLYDTTVKPTDIVMLFGATDISPVNLTVQWDGPANAWMGAPLVNNQMVPLSSISFLGNTSFSRRFTATVPVHLSLGVNYIPLSFENYYSEIPIELVVGGPNITGVTFGGFPGIQTELKVGDTVNMTVSFDNSDVTEIHVYMNDNVYASNSQVYTFAPGVTTKTVSVTIASTTNALLNLPVRLRLRNSFGSFGSYYTTSTLPINNESPTFSQFSVTYPNFQTAFKNTEAGFANLTISNQGANPSYLYGTTYLYGVSFPYFIIDDTTIYAPNKHLRCMINNMYNVVEDGGVNNYFVVVNRRENNKTSSFSGILNVVSIAPVITVTESSENLISGTPAQMHPITMSSNQHLLVPPLLDPTPGAGNLTGLWSHTSTSKVFTNTLAVDESDDKGLAWWVNLVAYGKSYMPANGITGDDTYRLGGMTSRSLSLSSLSRTALIGGNVANIDRLTVSESFRGSLSASSLPNGTTLNASIEDGNDEMGKFTIVSSSSPNVINRNGDMIFYMDIEAVNQNIRGSALFTMSEN